MTRLIFTITLIFLPAVLHAQDVYVTDKLQLQLRESKDDGSKILSRLSSGDKLTLLERGDSLSKVTAEDGTTGWVKSWFLVDTPPAVVQLEMANAEIAQLKKQNSGREKVVSSSIETSMEQPQKKLQERIKQLEYLIDQRDETIKLIQNESNRLKFKKSKSKEFDKKLMLYIAAAILVISFIAGFLTAVIRASRRQKKRLNGYRMSI